MPTCFPQNDTVFHKTTHKDEIVLGCFRQNDWGLGKKGFANIPDVFHTLQAFEDAFEDAHLFPFLPQRLELHPCKYQIHKKWFFSSFNLSKNHYDLLLKSLSLSLCDFHFHTFKFTTY